MTAKHRKGKGNHKHEDNFFKNEVMESEARTGGNNYNLLVVLLLFVIGGATGAWFCFQQHQTLTYLTDSLMGLQMKVVKLQSSHEDLRQSSSKQHISESLESRMNALEESYALAQKQVGMALATAEQLKTSDLPAQVLSLHTEMKARLAEMQQATVSLEQLSQLQSQLKGKSEEFDGVKIQIEGLATLSAELSQRVELLTGSQAETESKLEERFGQVTTLSKALDGQAADVLTLREQLDAYQAQLEASTLEIAAVRELFESEPSQPAHQTNMEALLNMLHQDLQEQIAAATSLYSELRAQLENVQKQVTQLVGETQPPGETVEQTDEKTVATAQEPEESAAATQEEKEGLPSDLKKEAEQRVAAAQDEAPVEQEFTETEDPAPPAEEVEAVKEVQTEQYGSLAKSDKKKVERRQPGDKGQSVEEDVPIEKNVKVVEEGKSEGQQIEESSSLVKAEREKLSEREEAREDNHNAEEEREGNHNTEEEREDNHNAEEERVLEREEVDDALASEGEKGLEKSLLQEEKLNVEEEVAEGQEEQEDVAAEVETDDTDKEEPLANYSLPEDKCK